MGAFGELFTHLATAIIGGFASYVWRRIREALNNRGRGSVLSGLTEHTLVVYPTRDGGAGRFLEQLSIEDFMAINNIVKLFIQTGRLPPKQMRDHKHVSDKEKRENSLILICSSKSNNITRDAIKLLRSDARYANRIPHFEQLEHNSDRIEIWRGGGRFGSKTYDQERNDKLDAERSRDDMAVIVKAPNPWNRQHKILILAGVRGIGTWGAADFLRKSWKEIHKKQRTAFGLLLNRPEDFSAIIQVHYEDSDVSGGMEDYCSVD